MEFPRMVHKANDRMVVANQSAYDFALGHGWVGSRADLSVAPAPEPTPDETPTVDIPPDGPKRRGRPRKG